MKTFLLAFTTVFFATIVPALHAEPAADTAAVASPEKVFAGLKRIYVASGAFDSGDSSNAGTATSVSCTNLGGKVANVRIRFFDSSHMLLDGTTLALQPKNSQTVSTHATFLSETILATGSLYRGLVDIASTQSAVFCSAMLVDAAGPGAGIALHMVRFNSHKETVE